MNDEERKRALRLLQGHPLYIMMEHQIAEKHRLLMRPRKLGIGKRGLRRRTKFQGFCPTQEWPTR